MNTRQTTIFGTLIALVLLGAGCSFTPVSSLPPKDAAEGLKLKQESEIVIRQTVLGVGGKFLSWLGEQGEDRSVTMKQWVPGASAELFWMIETEVETEDSKQAQLDYEEKYADSPVGVAIPSPPKKEHEIITKQGTLTTTALGQSETVLPPNLWPEGESDYDTNSLIWLSQKQYDELANTRSTNLRLGLFDAQLSSALEITDNVRNLINKFFKDKEASTEAEDLLIIEADPDWGYYLLKVDGVQTRVRTIEAKNFFGKYKILANRSNPLILEMVLTPASKGALSLSPDELLEGFVGYEVREINNAVPFPIQTEASNEGQPQQ